MIRGGMTASQVPFSQAEQTLWGASLFGIVPKSQEWSASLLVSLYKSIRSITADQFPPELFETTREYLPISYVQSPNNPPSKWAVTVYEVLARLYKDRGIVYGIWFDKMGSRQYPALQSVWAPLANLHYAVKPVIHVPPTLHDHIQHLSEKPVCGLDLRSNQLVVDWLLHHETCEDCFSVWRSNLADIGFSDVEDIIPCEGWVHPGAYFRCWPMVERTLALYNRGLITTEAGVMATLATCVALCGFVKAAHDVRIGQEALDRNLKEEAETSTGFRVLGHHRVHGLYECARAKAMVQALSPGYEETMLMMADRMAVDCTKAEPITADNPFQIARKLRGWTFGTPSTFIPLFANDLIQRYNLDTPDTIDFASAMTDIVSGWAGRAPCFAEGDKIGAVVLFANFRLGSQLSREKGKEWLKEFVDELYRIGGGLFNELIPTGFNTSAFENYSLNLASIGQNLSAIRLETEILNSLEMQLCAGGIASSHSSLSALRNSFGRYSGCIPLRAFVDFLSQCNKTDEQIQVLHDSELRLWQYHLERDGSVFVPKAGAYPLNDTQSLQPRVSNCPVCAVEKFVEIGSTWRATRGNMRKRTFWAFSLTKADGSLPQMAVNGVLLASGEMQMDVRFASRCLSCESISERKILRGWPKQDTAAWEAIFVVDEELRPPRRPSAFQRGNVSVKPLI